MATRTPSTPSSRRFRQRGRRRWSVARQGGSPRGWPSERGRELAGAAPEAPACNVERVVDVYGKPEQPRVHQDRGAPPKPGRPPATRT
eukprot:356444-Alexandrium_andersonii.AAC.1